MKTQILYTKLNLALITGLFVSLFAFTACDSSNALMESDAGAVAPSVASLTEQIQLTEKQAQDINELVAKRGEGQPGTLWYVAAELQNSLTADQKAELLKDIEQAIAGRTAGERVKGREAMKKRFQKGEHFEGVIGNLTDEQKAALKTLHEKQREEMKALVAKRREGSVDEDMMKEEAQKVRESMKEELAAILTEEQLAALKTVREERSAAWRERRSSDSKAEGPGPHGRSFGREVRGEFSTAKIEALGLTSEQQTRIETLMSAQKEKVSALFEELKASGEDREVLHEKMNAFREESIEAMADILTEEQQEVVSIHRALAFNTMKKRTGDAASRRGNRRFNRLEKK